MDWLRLILLLAMLVCFSPAVRTAPFQDSKDYEAKARFLLNVPEFVDWPASAFKTANSPLLICVYGRFSFGTFLADRARATQVQGHRLEVKWVRLEQELPSCQVLFVSHSEAQHYEKTLEAVRNSGTLTVGENPDFLRSGGMVLLEAANTGLLFDVNLDAVRDGRMKLSSQLLSLARRIVQRTEQSRS